MRSCAVSCCICFPKALSAFATSASSPTGGGLLSCRFAFNCSEPYSYLLSGASQQSLQCGRYARGLDGTPMASWTEYLDANQTWDLIHYIGTLQQPHGAVPAAKVLPESSVNRIRAG